MQRVEVDVEDEDAIEAIYESREAPRPTGVRIALVGQFAVTVDGLVTASLQLLADRRLAGAGDALDEKVPCAHSAW